jgi:hypothetical protein
MADNYYDAGTATVVAGSAAVSGTGTTWSTWGLLAGDTLSIDGVGVPIASVDSNTALTLAYGWPGADATAVAHVVLYTSPRRSGADIMVKVRELLAQIDLLGASVPYYKAQSVGSNTPPGSPVAGDQYVVGTSPTGAWAGQAKNIAGWTGSAWQFTAPAGGWHAYSVATNLQYAYVAGSWQLTDGVASVAGNTGTVTAAQLKTAVATAYIQTLLDDVDGAAALVTLGAQAALGYTPVNKAGDTLAGELGVRPAVNNGWSFGIGSGTSGTITLANAGAIGWLGGSGYLMIADHSSGNHALFKVANTLVTRLDSGAGYSTTPGNSGTLNVWWNSGGSFYALENVRGGPVAVSVMNFRVRNAG